LAPFLSMKGITKRFPGVLANDHVDLEVEQGEIHALLGENGAGKTTLMNILYGLYQPQEGEILIEGSPVRMTSVQDAIGLGIGMVHQHFMLIPLFTVAENIIMGSYAGGGLRLNTGQAAQKILELSRKYHLQIDPAAYVWQLSVGLQQRVEIIKALYRDARLLILDEPTAVLTPQETRELFEILRALARQNTSIIIISHKLTELMSISDRVTVLRDGRGVATVRTCETSPTELARMMVGRDVVLQVERPPQPCGGPALVLEDLRALNDKGLPALRGVSLHVECGEIVGLAGVDGNGQSELAEVLTGMRRAQGGRVMVDGEDLCNRTPDVIINRGVACVPQDRNRTGSIGQFSLAENLVLRSDNRPPFCHHGFLDRAHINRHAEQMIKEFDVRTPGIAVKAKALSGGNRQKLILAREVSRPHRILIAVQPTRGLDVGAIEAVYQRLLAERQRGTAILLISTELEEILSLSDRISVIYEGRIIGERPGSAVDIEELGLLMAGMDPDSQRTSQGTGNERPCKGE
jgi:general nucleoside transport system ATP-binding protein